MPYKVFTLTQIINQTYQLTFITAGFNGVFFRLGAVSFAWQDRSPARRVEQFPNDHVKKRFDDSNRVPRWA